MNRPRVEQSGDNRRPALRMSFSHGLFYLACASIRKLRPYQCDCPSHKRSRDTGAARRHRLAVRAKTSDTFARRAQTPPADGVSKVGFIHWSATAIASDDRDDPWMSRDGSAANRSLVASRRHDNDAAICGIVERLPQCAFAFSQWHLGESCAQIHKTSTSINALDNSSREF